MQKMTKPLSYVLFLQTISLAEASFAVHVFQLHDDGPATEDINDQEDDIAAANHWLLPSGRLVIDIDVLEDDFGQFILWSSFTADFHRQWDNLVYDSNVKEKV